MKSSFSHTFLITARKNLHVGSGNSTFGIIDNLVQRDAVTDYPCINASSMKGALREYAEQVVYEPKSPQIIEIFGSDSGNRDSEKFVKGKCAFFEGQLLSIPVRSSHFLFFRATSIERLNSFLKDVKMFDPSKAQILQNTLNPFFEKNLQPEKNKPFVFRSQIGGANNIYLEDYEAIVQDEPNIQLIEKYLGERIALFSENDFKTICDNEHLPIIARNKLDNGISSNLWYEQIVPREAVFYTQMIGDKNLELFDKKVIQIGGNATVGYGYCEFKLLFKPNN